MKLYVASPLGFSEAGREFYNGVLIPKLAALGLEILDPWTLTDAGRIAAAAGLPYGAAKREAWRELSVEIGRNNAAAIEACDALLAVLDGVDVDSGTAAEIGYAAALGKKIIGYRGDFRLAADNEGTTVNLQVEYFIRRSGGAIVSELAAIAGALRAIGL
jgi:nucleoside 2-deoxyribosyltransferase